MSLLKAYSTASQSALVRRSTLEEIKKLGFAVTPETLDDTLARMLATYRAAASILRKNGLGAQLDALLNATKISSE
jgi:beta-glucosidase/6-phospho-beta-glucosidase/beta-galactosidase